MPANNTTTTTGGDYTCVRFYVSTVSFSVLLFFNLIINSTIVRVKQLRSHARFVLIFHLLLSALVFLGMNSIFQYQIHRRAEPGTSACLAMISVLISSGSNILLTLTVMALDRYCAVCHPMRYTSKCTSGLWPWLAGVLTWLISSVIPLILLVNPGTSGVEYDKECGPDQLKNAGQQKMVFIGLCTLIILYSYARILMEGRRLGVLNRRNRAGCRTIALHGSQLAVYILPNFVNFVLTKLHKDNLVQHETKELSAVVNFAFFSLAQCVAPVIYGLRKEELMEQLSHRFPCCSRYLKSVLGWTVGVNWANTHHRTRERTMTAQTIISLEAQQVPEEEEEEEEEEETSPTSVMSSSHDLDSCQGDTDNA